ncbi:MAG: HlyD family secretion protein [Rhodobacteraceae bacterium HLUCCA24]|nr:MAG: HlyD family secretion protein [Rhodobacteraceae bacterium HLUCCA24]
MVERAAGDPDIRDLVDGQVLLFEARGESIARETEQLQRRAAQIGNQIEGIEAQQTALSRQLELIERELADQQSLLDRGLAQASRVLALEREQARLAGQMGELTAQKAQAEVRITEIDLEILSLDTRRREEAISRLRDLQFHELELAEQRRSLRNRLERLEIRAPVGGVVYGMQVTTPRSVLRPADPVMFIIPQDRPLVIASQVDPIDIDQIRVGQEVTLRFSSLNQRTTPELFGTVRLVSPDAFTEDGTRRSYYRVEITLSEDERNRLPENATLVPGMPVEAFIQTDSRTPVTYLVKPLSDYFAKAFRES